MKRKRTEVAVYKNGEYVFKTKKSRLMKKVASIGLGAMAVPGVVRAESTVNDTFGNVHTAILGAVDSGVVLIIIFAGASWMLGHRSRSIEILIGVACGYLIISNAVNLRDFLRSI